MNTKKLSIVIGTLLASTAAFAQETATAAVGATVGVVAGADYSFLGLAALGAGLCIGLAAFGAAGAQGKAAASALEGISRNPSASGSMFTPLILSLVFMEALGILAFLTANSLSGSFGAVAKKVFGLE